MEPASQTTELEYRELAGAVDWFAQRAPIADPAELVELWPALEQRVLDRVSSDGSEAENGAQEFANTPQLANTPRLEGERIRNLAWEIGVSVDLHAVHFGALRALAKLLRERGQRLGRRALRESNARSWAGRA